MARKYQHTMELLSQIKEMLAKGMTQKEVENALSVHGEILPSTLLRTSHADPRLAAAPPSMLPTTGNPARAATRQPRTPRDCFLCPAGREHEMLSAQPNKQLPFVHKTTPPQYKGESKNNGWRDWKSSSRRRYKEAAQRICFNSIIYVR